MAFDPDAYLAAKRGGKAETEDFDPDAYLAGKKTTTAPEPVQSEPARSKKTPAQIQYEIDRGMSPLPTFGDKLGAALDPKEMYNDLTAAGMRAEDQMSFGAIPYLDEKLAGYSREEGEAFKASRPGTEFGGNLMGMGVMGATGAGQPFATAGKNLVTTGVNAAQKLAPKLAPKLTKAVGEALPSARPIAESAVSGGLFSGTDAAVRGGDAGEVAKAAGVGALVGGAASALPVVAGGVGNLAHRAVLNRAVKPITDVAKGKVDKALSQFGGNKGIEAGEVALRDFVDKQNLQPVLRARGHQMEEQFQGKKAQVWTDKLEPIYQKAYAAEPKASVPVKEITDKLRGMVAADERGTSRGDLIKQYIGNIESIAEAEGFGSNFPVRNLINKARDLQGRGHSGVVNYDSPTENKEIEREVGRMLRTIGNERVSKIFMKNPKVAAEALGRSTEGAKRPKVLADGMDNPDVQAVGEQFREGNKLYSDYSKLDPLVDQAAKNQARDRQPFAVRDMMARGGGATSAAGLGYLIGGAPGAAIGGGGALLMGKAAPYLERGAESAARALSGEAFNPLASLPKNTPLTKAQIAGMMATPVGIEALKEYFRGKVKKK
jgi:hypothetical protein